MIQFVFCLLMLVPLAALPVGVFLTSGALGVLAGLGSLAVAVPVMLAASAHLDLHRAKSRYGLSEEELAEFARLVPQLARRPDLAGRRTTRDLRRSAKETAAKMIRDARGAPL
jgi:hypothetical protein